MTARPGPGMATEAAEAIRQERIVAAVPLSVRRRLVELSQTPPTVTPLKTGGEVVAYQADGTVGRVRRKVQGLGPTPEAAARQLLANMQRDPRPAAKRRNEITRSVAAAEASITQAAGGQR